MLTSLLENNRRHHMEIWIATTDNDPDNRRRFLTLEADYDCRIHIIHVMQEEIDSLPDAKGEWPKEMYLRLVLIKTLPVYVPKIIYFDGDIIVNTDIISTVGASHGRKCRGGRTRHKPLHLRQLPTAQYQLAILQLGRNGNRHRPMPPARPDRPLLTDIIRHDAGVSRPGRAQHGA